MRRPFKVININLGGVRTRCEAAPVRSTGVRVSWDRASWSRRLMAG